jgi:hypothetical protein
MYIRRPNWKSQNGKTYQSAWLCESYREDGKSKTRYLLNLGGHSESTLNALEYALKHIPELDRMAKHASLGANADIRQRQGKSIGAAWAVRQVAEELGIVKALGGGRQAQLALWQIVARVIDQGSRLSAVRLHDLHALAETVGLEKGFSEDDLYDNLAWLSERQERIEANLFRKRRKDGANLYLYDVTSSYLEGEENAFAAYGYNRDKKKGKKRIVVGLLADADGDPVSVEVFRGNCLDFQTLEPQIHKTAERFGCREVTFVGDRGMIKNGQIEELSRHGFHYLTALSKPTIERLVQEGVLQMSLFDERICEVGEDGRRYILRRNPYRAEEMAATRKRKFASLNAKAEEATSYLLEHPRARTDLAITRMEARVKKLGMDKYCQVELSERTVTVRLNEEAMVESSRLDGCYVIVTDLSKSQADAETVHARYKDLAKVEQAFRISKTGHLELRPVYVRTAESTRGHVFVVMLSYLIRRRLATAWADMELTVENGLDALKTLCLNEIRLGDGPWMLHIPEASDVNDKLLSRLGMSMPKALIKNEAKVGMRNKLAQRRISSKKS